MKLRKFIEITVTSGGRPMRLRIVAKPSRYLATRYWVMVPSEGTRPDRWTMEPSIEAAVLRVAKWLAKESNRHFSARCAAGNEPHTEKFSETETKPFTMKGIVNETES